MIDQRCRRDGAYTRDQRDGTLYRCLGSRLQDSGNRVGYEDVVDPTDVRWVKPQGTFIERLRFVCQGEASTPREVVEAMR